MKPADLPLSETPRHVAIVMDGNGRWAQRRGLPRLVGHQQGVLALKEAVRRCAERGIEYLTVYAFSTENWKRPQEEVSGLMRLVPMSMKLYLPQLKCEGVRIRILGDTSGLSAEVRSAWERMEQATAGNMRMTLIVAFNYGGRWDITRACQRAIADGIAPGELSEDKLGRYMMLEGVPDPDLLIRTGGESRLSNFLLWQLAYAELFFTDVLWPDFAGADLDEALAFFRSRERRFGALPEELPLAARLEEERAAPQPPAVVQPHAAARAQAAAHAA